MNILRCTMIVNKASKKALRKKGNIDNTNYKNCTYCMHEYQQLFRVNYHVQTLAYQKIKQKELFA